MILSKLENIVIGNFFYGVEVCINDGSVDYYITEVKKSKESLVIVKTDKNTDFNTLVNVLSKDFPVILTFTGVGIINRKEQANTNYRSKILFNSNQDDFYWNEFNNGNDIYVSVARKDTIDKELLQWKSAGFYVVMSFLGPFVAVNCKMVLDFDAINTKTSRLDFRNDKLKSFVINDVDSYEQEVYTIDDQELQSNYVVGFSSVIDYLFPNRSITSSIDIKDNKEEFIYKKLFSVLGTGSILILFSLLLISFFFLQRYQKQINIKTSELSEKQVVYNSVLKLKEDKINKETILRKSGIHNNNFLSYYVWKLTDILPLEIQLSKLEVFPSNGKLKKGQAITFKTNYISVSGYVKYNKALSKWIKQIKRYEWVDSVEIIGFNSAKADNKFTLKIRIK